MTLVLERQPGFAERIGAGAGQGLQTALSVVPQFAQMSMNMAIAKQARHQQANEMAQNILTSSGISNPSAKMQAEFAQNAQKYIDKGMGYGDIQKQLTEDAIRLGEMTGSAEGISKPRVGWQGLKEVITGKGLEGDKRLRAAKAQIAPLVKAGYIDEARAILRQKKFGLIETETILGDLGVPVKESLETMPDFKDKKGFYYKGFGNIKDELTGKETMKPEAVQMFRDNLKQTLSMDPSSNLILLRDAYEKKGVTWDEFRSAIDDLVDSGQISLTREQEKNLKYLQEPSLDRLEKLLHGFKLISK